MAHKPLFRPEVLRQKTLGLHPDYREAQIRLDGDDRAVLRRVNGQATVATIGQLTELSDDRLIAIVLRLAARQKLVFADELPFFSESELMSQIFERVEGAPRAKETRLDDTDESVLAVVDGERRLRELAPQVAVAGPLLALNVLRLAHAGLIQPLRGLAAARAIRERREGETAVPGAAPSAPAETSAEPESVSPSPLGAASSFAARLRRMASDPRGRKVLQGGGALVLVVLIAVGLGRVRGGGSREPALTVESFADLMPLEEIRTNRQRRWTGIVRPSFRVKPRADRVKAAQELVRRVQAAGYAEIVVQEPSGDVVAQFDGSMLTVAD